MSEVSQAFMSNKTKMPEVVELTQEEMDALFARLDSSDLRTEDRALVKGVLRSTLWLRQALEAGKITIHKLKGLFGKFRSEKRSQKKDKSQEDSEEEEPCAPSNENEEISDTQEHTSVSPTKPPAKGHGRLGADAYPEAEKIDVPHATLKAGSACPTECGGRLYQIDPGVLIRVQGQQMARVVKYHLQKLRCSSCGFVETADLPEEVRADKGKYDARFKASLACQKYFAGVPFFRQEDFQAMLGFPLPDSTQWDLIEQVADAVYPVLGALEEVAANGELIHGDDTGVTIAEVIKMIREDPTIKRKGTFTSAFYAYAASYVIALYYSGRDHAGENLVRLLTKRRPELPPIIHMSDALAANVMKEIAHLILKAFCLAHARRYFEELLEFYPKECGHVLEQIGKVYHHDAEAKEQGFSEEERLRYHQKKSKPVMEALEIWLKDQASLFEPNGYLSKAIGYTLKHWQGLTLFLREAGAPLDNNVCEQMIKLAIRLRKNSLSHRTLHGAYVAGLLMSLIQTCRVNNINPVDYLTACQQNKKALFKDPHAWLPWVYQETLAQEVHEKIAA